MARMADSNYSWLDSYPPNIQWDSAIEERPLFTLLDEAAQKYPDALAINFLGKKISYRELGQQVDRMAAGLQSIGVGSGIRVGIFMPNCPQFVISYYAILKAGGTVVNYSPLYSIPEVSRQINDSKTEIMITLALNLLYPKVAASLDKTCLKRIVVSELSEALPFAKSIAFRCLRKKEIASVPGDDRHIAFTALMKTGHVFSPVTVQPSTDIAVLQYTGGTTGVPKAAVLSHANLYANTVQCGLWFTGLRHGQEMIVGALPLFHVFAMTTIMNLALHTGSAMLLYPKFEIRTILKGIHHKKPTLMPGVPTMFAAFNNYKDIGKYNLSSLKMCISGGGPLPHEVRLAFEERTGCKLIEGYGLSEASPVAAANPLFGVNKKGSIGIPFPATVMRVLDMHGTGEMMPVNAIGEICVRGPQVMQGYLNQPDESSNVLKEGFLHTGDLGYMDEDGYFFVVDRLKEMIICGGYKVYPRNIEEVLYQHPQILEAAVIGVPHPQRVQEPKAFIVLRAGESLTDADIRNYLRDKISAYAMPRTVEFRDSLPKSAIGKVLKKLLVEEIPKIE